MLKKYEKLDKIGQGSFGKVYKVRSRKTRQLLVLKEIDLSCMGPKTRRDAENEVKILKTIKHRHIVGFVEAFKQSGKFLVLFVYIELVKIFWGSFCVGFWVVFDECFVFGIWGWERRGIWGFFVWVGFFSCD